MVFLPLLLTLTPVRLVWTPQTGDTATYDAKYVFAGSETASALTVHGTLKRTIRKAVDGRVDVAEEYRLAGPQGGKEGERVISFESVLRPNGALDSLAATGADPTTCLRAARLAQLVLPPLAIEVGDAWAVMSTPVVESQKFGAKATYTFVGEEKVGERTAYKIASKASETGVGKGTAAATFWIDPTTGMPLRTHYTLEGLDGTGRKIDADLVLRL